jgi:hypothetical protein
MKRIDRRTLAFWLFTGAFAALMVVAAAMYLGGSTEVRDTLVALGYPAYILIILGTAKLAGAIALLQGRSTMLREWAYAGFTINLVGAAASHALAGDPASAALKPAVLLLPLAASYALRPERQPHGTRAVRSEQPLAA